MQAFKQHLMQASPHAGGLPVAQPAPAAHAAAALYLGRQHLPGDVQGLCLFAKRLEKSRIVWPSTADAAAALTPAQLAMLLEGIDWRAPLRTDRPTIAG